MTRERCSSCGKFGHVATEGDAWCSKAFRAVRLIVERKLSMREAADAVGLVTVASVSEELRRNPEAHRIAIARNREIWENVRRSNSPRPVGADGRKSLQTSTPLAELAVNALENDHARRPDNPLECMSIRETSEAYGVTYGAVHYALRKKYPDGAPWEKAAMEVLRARRGK